MVAIYLLIGMMLQARPYPFRKNLDLFRGHFEQQKSIDFLED